MLLTLPYIHQELTIQHKNDIDNNSVRYKFEALTVIVHYLLLKHYTILVN